MEGSRQIFDFLQPDPNEKKCSSGTKDGIDPKPGPKFEFVHCLKVNKKPDQFGPWKDPGGPSKWKGPPKFSTFYSLIQMKKNYSSGTKDGIGPKPGSNFDFVHCLRVYKKNQPNLERSLQRP